MRHRMWITGILLVAGVGLVAVGHSVGSNRYCTAVSGEFASQLTGGEAESEKCFETDYCEDTAPCTAYNDTSEEECESHNEVDNINGLVDWECRENLDGESTCDEGSRAWCASVHVCEWQPSKECWKNPLAWWSRFGYPWCVDTTGD